MAKTATEVPQSDFRETDTQTAELRQNIRRIQNALSAETTEGPWEPDVFSGNVYLTNNESVDVAYDLRLEDAEYIASVNPVVVTTLLNELKKLRPELFVE